jgi:aerobic carbon-monoxide dehydrogenase medium subunit
MKNFEFQKPTSVKDAVALLGKAGGNGKLLAGGQSLIPVLKQELAEPSHVITLGAIAGLDGISLDGDTVVIGARVTHADVAASDVVKKAIPALAKLASQIGDPQVRNRGTLGGSLAHADPAADYPAAVVALDATIETDRRKIPAADFFKGLFATALAPDEIITAVRFPKPQSAAYAKFASPASKFAIVGVMVAKTSGGVRVAVTGAGPSVFRVAEMEKALSAKFSPDAIASISVKADELNTDLEASAAYRAHLVGVMARRAVAAAAT